MGVVVPKPLSQSPVRYAVVPAAGLGTRMLPATKAVRKELLPIAGKPMIQYAIEEAAASGIENVTLVSDEDSSNVLRYFQRNLDLEQHLQGQGKAREAELIRNLASIVNLSVVRQAKPLGLGDAVACAEQAVRGAFVVLLPDVIIHATEPCAAQLIRASADRQVNAIAVRSLRLEEVRNHGVVVGDGEDSARCFLIKGLVEKPEPEKAPSRFGVFGRYLLQHEVFHYLREAPSYTGAEAQFTDALDRMARHVETLGVLFAGEHYDAGDPTGFIVANVATALRAGGTTAELRSRLTTLLGMRG